MATTTAGLRWTEQRERILSALRASPGTHPTARELSQRLRDAGEPISQATVYRTLDLMEDLQLIRRLDFGDGSSRYEPNDRPHHHHVICLRCGQIAEVAVDWDKLVEAAAPAASFCLVEQPLQLFGYCQECACGGHQLVYNQAEARERMEDGDERQAAQRA